MIIKKYNRKNFFNMISKGSLYAFLASALPFKLFSSNRKSIKNINVQIHSSAVKRNNKV
jgi:hypothetical protein